MTLNDFLRRLDGVKKNGSGYVAKCPAHPDDKPSLSIGEGKNGGIVLHCHAGCTAEKIVASIGITMRDIMPQETTKPKQRKVVATYDYEDESGRPVYCVKRYEPKDFRQGKYANGRYVANMDGVKRVPFRLPNIIKAAKEGRPVFVVEGEKDVLTAEKMGAVATCNAGGAGKWQDEWVEYFKGVREVYVIADNDGKEKNYPGQRHAYHVRESMRKAGIKATALIMPEGKDLTEWHERGHGKKDLAEIVRNLPPWPVEFEFDRVKLEDSFDIRTLADFPPYRREEDNPNILIKGRWLERGGSAFWISTAGTGKSIASIQLAMTMSEGKPFAGLKPNKPLKFWIIQSEDSGDRVAIDREGIVEELSETMPEIEWRKTCGKVDFVKFPGKIGADFIDQLDAALTAAENRKPDVLIINPFLAYIGGPVTDGAYVTPFLRGGTISRKETKGLQSVLEKHGIGAIIFHHTPKPPSEKEIDAWMKSRFPEYQGAGASDITNWGRSFVTMMRVKGHNDIVCLTAGKNGGEIGWDDIDGAFRHYLAYSRGKGIDGRRRHAWRDLDDDEYAEITKHSRETLADDVEKIVEELKRNANTYDQTKTYGLTRSRYRAAWNEITKDCTKFGLSCVEIKTGQGKHRVFGIYEKAMNEAAEIQRKYNNSQKANDKEQDTSKPVVIAQPQNQVPPTATNCQGTRLGEPTADCQPPVGGQAVSRQSPMDAENDDQLPYGSDNPYQGEF